MNSLNENLDDSALCTLSVIHKRKASGSISQKKPKSAKLDCNFLSKNNEQWQSDENLNESTSSYFNKKFSNMCPLCLKVIESNAVFMAHTKSCAKKHRMTTQELLKALELQKKHIKERKELGLPSPVLPWNKKTVRKKSEKIMESCDVALGIALSKSLQDTKAILTEKGKATLEEFGFKTKQVSTSVGNGSRRNKAKQKSTLKLRTEEDRQRIITEKVAIVLLDEDSRSDFKRKAAVRRELNAQSGDTVSHLWNLGENEGQIDWYIKEMKPLLVEEGEVSKACMKGKTNPSLFKDVQDAVSQLNCERLSNDWRKMINNSKSSDLIGRTNDSQTVYLHSLVLQTRCANILERDFQSVFEKFSFSTILIFLEFLYCGTLKSLIESEVKNLAILAGEFDYDELIILLNCFKGDEKTFQKEITNTESNQKIVAHSTDKTLFSEDMIDRTPSSHSTNYEKSSEDEYDVEKKFWSFIQKENEREEESRKEEKKENSLLRIEKEKIGVNTKQKHKRMQEVMESKKDCNFRDSLESENICSSQTISPLVYQIKENTSDCIILSSDSETRWSEPEAESTDLKISSPINLDYEIPSFDPYYDAITCMDLSPVNSQSESLISGNISCEFPHPQEIKAEDKLGYSSTPMAKHHNVKAKFSNKKPFLKKRRSDLSASRIIRKSLNLKPKRTSNSTNRKTKKRKGISEEKVNSVSSNSVLHDLSKSFTSEPQSIKNFVEITPRPGKDEFEECVTPSPNYSNMGDSVLKEHLSRYGLKRSMGKCKAKKILRHIYEELHPCINTETGKIVKMLPGKTPTRKKKTTRKITKQKDLKPKANCGNSSKGTLKASDDSDGSEFGNLTDSFSQTLSNNSVDLPSAFCEFIENNVEFHTKILLYEPIWLEDLQSSLKKMFKKHFKLSDIMDYLDQKCITFRTQAQKRVNQKRAGDKSPQKKTLK